MSLNMLTMEKDVVLCSVSPLHTLLLCAHPLSAFARRRLGPLRYREQHRLHCLRAKIKGDRSKTMARRYKRARVGGLTIQRPEPATPREESPENEIIHVARPGANTESPTAENNGRQFSASPFLKSYTAAEQGIVRRAALPVSNKIDTEYKFQAGSPKKGLLSKGSVSALPGLERRTARPSVLEFVEDPEQIIPSIEMPPTNLDDELPTKYQTGGRLSDRYKLLANRRKESASKRDHEASGDANSPIVLDSSSSEGFSPIMGTRPTPGAAMRPYQESVASLHQQQHPNAARHPLQHKPVNYSAYAMPNAMPKNKGPDAPDRPYTWAPVTRPYTWAPVTTTARTPTGQEYMTVLPPGRSIPPQPFVAPMNAQPGYHQNPTANHPGSLVHNAPVPPAQNHQLPLKRARGESVTNGAVRSDAIYHNRQGAPLANLPTIPIPRIPNSESNLNREMMRRDFMDHSIHLTSLIQGYPHSPDPERMRAYIAISLSGLNQRYRNWLQTETGAQYGTQVPGINTMNTGSNSNQPFLQALHQPGPGINAMNTGSNSNQPFVQASHQPGPRMSSTMVEAMERERVRQLQVQENRKKMDQQVRKYLPAASPIWGNPSGPGIAEVYGAPQGGSNRSTTAIEEDSETRGTHHE